MQQQDAVATSLCNSFLNVAAISDCHHGDWKLLLRHWLMYSGNANTIPRLK